MHTETESVDPRWPKLLSLAVHEFRTPITVVNGYIRMLLKERAGPISEQQRKLLEEAEKSCGRLSALVAEMSDLSALEGGTAALNRSSIDLARLMAEAIAALPDMNDREIAVELQTNGEVSPLSGDVSRLRGALTAVLAALRRELVTSERLVVRIAPTNGTGAPASRVMIAGDDQIASLDAVDPTTLERFDEWRGGSGLSLAIARRIIGQHGGTIYNPPGGGKAGAVVVLPGS